MREITYREAVREAMREEMRRDSAVFQLGEDIGVFGGSYKVTLGLVDEFGTERILDTPLAEAGIAGAAVGSALVGMRPVAEIMYIDFSTLASDMIINTAAKMRFMSGGTIKLPIVIRTQEGGGVSAGPQHSQCLEMMFAHVPGLIVVLPATPYDAKGLLKSAIREDNPVIFIEHKGMYASKGPVPEEEYLIPLGKADMKREGKDITVVALSRSVLFAMEAAERLAREGIEIEIIDPMTIKPLDRECIIQSVKKTGRLLIVHEACKMYGFGAEVAALVADEAIDYLDAPIKRIGALDVPIPFGMRLENFVLPNAGDIVEAARQLMA
ncbi:MAG: alpha-ketoacid dehydrogenase subunit beta [Deltaproteobacteria bacterium]|nr:alpha-ketoacid dehydrogenase subunit beta [Deltaproteobacteria bacterium]